LFSTLRLVAGRVKVVARALGAATAWGVGLGWWFDASLVNGALLGLWCWGPAIILSFRWRDLPVDDRPLDAFGP
jgi:hypothetical protein